MQSWGGTRVRTARSEQETWYGPSSLHYFIGRITSFFSSALQQTLSVDSFVPESAAKLLLKPTASAAIPQSRQLLQREGTIPTENLLNPPQEEYFLSLYWQSFHTALFPILDEAEFMAHYRSLWTANSTERLPSALVDIVLAMCMQYGVSSLPATKQGIITDNRDATIAGRWYYRRCQMLLSNELESPTIRTLQCHLLCTIFLCSASFQNMSDSACALAVRNAYMLGLHLEPSSTLPLRERELRKRLWWTVHLLDSKIGMKLGRPFLLHNAPDMPSLPGDGLGAAMVSGSNFAPLGDNVTWLSFNLQSVKLFIAAKQAHVAFYGTEPISGQGQTVWDDPQTLESYAVVFNSHANILYEWANHVPSVLKTKRQNDGAPFSTDFSLLEIEEFTPSWLQRQRVVLELMYHHLCTNIYRPFISFHPAAEMPPFATENAGRSASHAIALTNITHQILSSTSILDGWLEAFQFQWNAAMTLVGFLLAYPNGLLFASVRNGLCVCIVVFDIFGKSLPVGASAASILRDLSMKLDFLSVQRQTYLPRTNIADEMPASEQPVNDCDLTKMADIDSCFTFADIGSQQAIDIASQSVFDSAIAVDLWGDLDLLWQNIGNVESGLVT
ncbi:hypothetical protein BP6252_08911 [Coleophoma cylindrospora]|uniref:Xylanolytic transcriptional activator regulatory domain-containing protein n=1 Tax=Coleophoma cylindrospora TaxID=1849047 RepID=A0A3D8R0I1_9HELO|nr:hypothetical protein BP6252_08911 [Coleophoma cylindrospora]